MIKEYLKRVTSPPQPKIVKEPKKAHEPPFKLTEDEFIDMASEYQGFCLSCKIIHDCLEKDSVKYYCPECKQNAVYSVQELLGMGKISIVKRVV